MPMVSAGGDDHSPADEIPLGCGEDFFTPLQAHSGDLCVQSLDTCVLRPSLKVHTQQHPIDSLGKTGVVFDIGSLGHLTAGI